MLFLSARTGNVYLMVVFCPGNLVVHLVRVFSWPSRLLMLLVNVAWEDGGNAKATRGPAQGQLLVMLIRKDWVKMNQVAMCTKGLYLTLNHSTRSLLSDVCLALQLLTLLLGDRDSSQSLSQRVLLLSRPKALSILALWA